MRIEVYPEGQVAAHAADRIAAALREAVRERGHASLALSGGTTANALLDELAGVEMPWEHIDLFQVDERIAPNGHPDRNLTDLQQRLVARVPVPAGQLHPMPVTAADLEAAADRHAQTLRTVAGDPPQLDVVHLGLGADGHTASLVPGSALLDEHDRLVAVTAPYQGRRRMTLTLPVLATARRVLWFVRGPEKAAAVRRLVDGDGSIPAGRVPTGAAVVVIDEAAASEVARS